MDSIPSVVIILGHGFFAHFLINLPVPHLYVTIGTAMQVTVKTSAETHYWINILWCALGGILIGGIAVISYWIRRCRKVKHIMKKLHKQNGLKRSNSAIEFDVSALTAANRRQIYSRNRSVSSEQDNSDHSEHSEKSPLVSARLDNLARLLFSKSMPAETGSRDTIESVLTTRPNLKCQYSALDSGNGVVERSPRERANREHAHNATEEWIQRSNGRYEILAHLDEIGSRHGKNWFLVTDSSVRTDRLLTLLPLPSDCIAFENLPANDNPKSMELLLMELLGSLHHPYIYPVLDLGFLQTGSASASYACLVTPFNSRGSLKDLIYKSQWNEPWKRKYTRQPNGLPVSQVQRLGRQILEALLFLKERGFPLHGHLHSGNVILQNGAARLSGLENGLLGLSSRINAVMWSRSTTDIENVDIICFGHLIYEMSTGQEMTTPKPSMRVFETELENYPQILDVLSLIFHPSSGCCPSVEELVMCDLFRSIDLRELRGPCFSTIKPSLSRSTLNLLHAVKKRQCASLGNSLSETCSPCSPPLTPRGHRLSGTSRTMDSFDIISDLEEDGLLEEIVVSRNYHQHHYQHMHKHQYYRQHLQQQQRPKQHHTSSLTLSTRYYDLNDSPIHNCPTQSDDNSCIITQEPMQQKHNLHSPKASREAAAPIICCTYSGECNVSRVDGIYEGHSAEMKISSADHGNRLITKATISNTYDKSTGKSSAFTPIESQLESEVENSGTLADSAVTEKATTTAGGISVLGNASSTAATATSSSVTAGASFNHQLTADLCSYKNSKSRRLEYSLKCLKYGRSNPSQDSAFGSLTDNDSSSFRLNSFQSISSPIDEGVEDVIIATTTAGNETCLELATIPRHMVSQDSAISSPCRDLSPNNVLNIVEDTTISRSCSAASSSSSGSTGIVRPHQFPVSLSPKIFVTATTNSSNSSLASCSSTTPHQHHQQFDPPKILLNDQNSIYTTSPSKRSGSIEVFSQKYRVSSFEDMSPSKRCKTPGTYEKHHLKNVNRMAFRSLEEEQRIDNAFLPISKRTNSENQVNIMQTEKYKKLTHTSFRISKTSSQMLMYDTQSYQLNTAKSSPGSTHSSRCAIEMKRPATATGARYSHSNRQTVWRDSKFYRKNHIAKSNDSLLEISPNRRSPFSLRDNNHYDSYSSSCGSQSHSRQTLHHGCSINEVPGSQQVQGMGLTVTTTSFCGDSSGVSRRYYSSKSEDLGESNEYSVMDARKSYSERYLVTLSKLKQNSTNSEQFGLSDDLTFNDNTTTSHNCKLHYEQQQHQCLCYQRQPQHSHSHQAHRAFPNEPHCSSCPGNRQKLTQIDTTSLSSTAYCQSNNIGLKTIVSSEFALTSACSSDSGSGLTTTVPSPRTTCCSDLKTLDHHGKPAVNNGDNEEENSSLDESPSRRMLSTCPFDDPASSEEKTPLLDSAEMSPISPTEP